jgi:hypothetical protein
LLPTTTSEGRGSGSLTGSAVTKILYMYKDYHCLFYSEFSIS